MRLREAGAAHLAVFVALLVGGAAARGEAVEIRSATTLWNIGEPANVHNPECGAGEGKLTAGDVILKAGAAAIDAYTGSPVASNIVEHLDEPTRNWLKVRLGIHGGKSSCATQCVVYSTQVQPRLEACLVEDNGTGLQCTAAAADYPWGRVENFTTASTGTSRVFCAHGKNWSHDRNRFFYVTATY